MDIKLPSELEAALNESARRSGLSPQELAVSVLQERLLGNSAPFTPTDDWERALLA